MKNNSLLHENKYLQQILSNMKEEIFVVDKDLKIIYVNGTHRFGYDKKLIQHQIFSLVGYSPNSPVKPLS